MADSPIPGIGGLEMLLERLSAIESHTRIAAVFRQRDAEALPAGSELTSDMYDCGTLFSVTKFYEGRLHPSDFVVLDWDCVLTKRRLDLLGWCNGTSVLDECDRAVERSLGAAETARLRAACLALLESHVATIDGEDYEVMSADVGIAQGPFVPKGFMEWWLNEGLKALMPEVVAATWGSAVLDLSEQGRSRPLARVFEIVQKLVSSVGFEVELQRKFSIEMIVAPSWQVMLLKAEMANGSVAVEEQLKADLASRKGTKSQVDAMLRRHMFGQKDEQERHGWMSDSRMSDLCAKIGYRL